MIGFTKTVASITKGMTKMIDDLEELSFAKAQEANDHRAKMEEAEEEVAKSIAIGNKLRGIFG